MDVGVRELKQRLSEFLKKVAAGQVVRVTDRGRPLALLSPVPASSQLARGTAEGWIRAASRLPGASPQRHRARMSTREALREDRG